jgi:hypothetical protein
MTEAEWFASDNARTMLGFVRGSTSNRKLWLFASACVGTALETWAGEICQQIRRTAEDVAAGVATHEELRRAWQQAQSWMEQLVADQEWHRAVCIRDWQEVLLGKRMLTFGGTDEEQARRLDGVVGAHQRGLQAASWATWIPSEVDTNPTGLEFKCVMLRDIFGNPFRLVQLDPSWLNWNGATIRELSQAIYNERAFDHLPILADALEEAGCTDTAVLEHCRGPGPHVLGCWVVDAVLGKS